ncbi:MAG: hypothetical protein KKA42_07180, partial [candidate division Zixibacteria bacterium]|nr:hypothetical protein [candidate division Zixibacteria bacterium]
MTKRLSLTASVLAALFTLSAGAVLAEIQDGIAYDIYQKDGRLCTWVDLAAFLDGHEISRLRDGIDLMFDCRLTLS